jgi:hypothetical protein
MKTFKNIDFLVHEKNLLELRKLQLEEKIHQHLTAVEDEIRHKPVVSLLAAAKWLRGRLPGAKPSDNWINLIFKKYF